MQLLSSLHKVPIVFLLLLCCLCPGLHAQDKSALDTIAYMQAHQKSPVQLCDDLFALGTYYLFAGNYENALLAARTCQTLAEKNNYEKGIYNAYSISGNVRVGKAEYDKAMAISQEWLQLATRNHNEPAINLANYFLTLILYRQGNLDSAVAIAQRILEAPAATYDSVTFPKFNSLLGAVFISRGDYGNANIYYLAALQIAEKKGNEEMQTVCISNLAIVNQALGNSREAIKYHKKILGLEIKNNLMLNLAITYENLGIVYESLNMHDSAFYYYYKALPLFQQLGSDENIAQLHDNIGFVFMVMEQVDSALYFLQMAKQEYSALQSADLSVTGRNLLNLGFTWTLVADAKKDKSYLTKGLREFLACKTLVEEHNIEDVKMDCYKQLSFIYKKFGNESQAYTYLKKYSDLADSIRSQDLTQQIAEMQTKYETEKKEAEIIKLNAAKSLDAEKIARQRTLNFSLIGIALILLFSGFFIFSNVAKKRAAEKQVALLEKQNAIETMRTKIASDVHDEMGANLTRLGLNAQQLLQIPAVPEKGKQLAEKMALQSKDIITGMREIIWASNPANDNLKSMLGFMRQYIDRFFDGTHIRTVINFPHEVGEVTLHPEVRRNLFLILKESLNNAVKYSGSDRIDIDFRNENDSFNLNIKDYGKGFDDQNREDYSNGLQNMKMRAELIQSLFQLITAPGQGVQISVEGKLY